MKKDEEDRNQDNGDNEIGAKKIIVFPYIKKISEKAATLVSRSKFTVGLRCLNRLDNHIRVHKDKTEYTYRNNIVYKIECNNCDALYVGQTKRHLKTRINEHINNKKLSESRHTVVTNHIMELKHSFNWQNTIILDSEPNYNKRLISEMLYIKEQTNGINLQKDTEFLNDAYYCLLRILTNERV